MNESILQIVVTAVNEAATQLSEVVESLTGISEQAAETSSSATASLSEIGEIGAQSAASVSESWDESLADLDSMMAGANETMAEGFSGMAEDAATASGEMESSISSVGGKIQAVGIQLGILGAGIAAPAVEAVKAAGDQQDAFDQLGNTITNVYASASAPTAGYSTEVADLTAKINAQKASIAEADAAMQKWTGTTAEVSANHEKAAASVATAQVNIQKLEQQLATLTNGEQLAGGSAAQTTAQFEAAAKASTSLGFNAADSATALTYLFSSTQSVNETMSAYQDAMDLSAKLNIPLTAAANDVVQAMNGQGRSLRDLGINVADGLSGQTALAAIQEKVAGAAQLAATEGLGPLNVATAKMNEAMADFGTTVLPMLADFLEELTKIIAAVDGWAEAHPKLAEALLIFLALTGSILIVLGAILVPLGLLIIGIEAFSTALIGLNVTMLGAMLTVGLYVAAFLAIAAIVALVIVYHKQIMEAIEGAWNWIINFVAGVEVGVYQGFVIWGQEISAWWQGLWNGIVSVLDTVWSKIQTIINGILAAVAKVTGAVSAVAGAVGATVGGVGNAIGGAVGNILHVNDAIITPSGQVIQTDVADYLFATKNPGAIGANGGGGGIVININGGYYLDQNAAQQIGNALATSIGRQLKLKNYA